MLRSLRFAISAIAFQRWRLTTAIILLSVFACASALLAQAGFEDDRVMLQGFYWESYRHGHPEKFPNYGDKQLVATMRSRKDLPREAIEKILCDNAQRLYSL
jgi:hypothetical protein